MPVFLLIKYHQSHKNSEYTKYSVAARKTFILFDHWSITVTLELGQGHCN